MVCFFFLWCDECHVEEATGPECSVAARQGGEAREPRGVAVTITLAAGGGALIAGWTLVVGEAAGRTDVVASPAPPCPPLLVLRMECLRSLSAEAVVCRMLG